MTQPPLITSERVRLAVQSRFNPLRDITPARMGEALDRWRNGYLRDAAVIMDRVFEQDDCTRSVASKRLKAVARHGYEICRTDDSPESERHFQVLSEFWDNITASSALERDETGGVRLLARQMAGSIGMRYAVHEVVWKPTANPRGLTAEFTQAPLWWFESTEGKLRFLPNDSAINGVEMDPAAWMVTVGDGLMIPTVVTWMLRRLPLQDWLVLSEKFGMPIIDAETSEQPGTDGWERFKEALAAIAADGSILRRAGMDKVTALDVKFSGEAPQAKLVERCERWIMALWRGGDLGTMSKGDSVGSEPQQQETTLLEEDDRHLIAETLQTKIEKRVIAWWFGPTVKPLAYIKFSGLNLKNTEMELKIDEFLASHRIPLSQQDIVERYGRALAAEGEPILETAPAPQPALGLSALANSQDPKFDAAAKALLIKAAVEDLAPIRTRLKAILAIQDPEILRTKLAALRGELEQLKRDMGADPAMATALDSILSTAVLNGMTA